MKANGDNLDEYKMNFIKEESEKLVNNLIDQYKNSKKLHEMKFSDGLLVIAGIDGVVSGIFYKAHPINANGLAIVTLVETIAISRIIYNRIKYCQDKRALAYLYDLQSKLLEGKISNINRELLNSKKDFKLAANNFAKECCIEKRKQKQLSKKRLV